MVQRNKKIIYLDVVIMCENINEEDVVIKSLDIKHMSVLEYLKWKTNKTEQNSEIKEEYIVW